MRIRRILIENFRPFYGRQELDLTTVDEEKNILVIVGENGRGKTSFLNAIEWVLYGTKPRRRLALFNRSARKEKGAVVSVELSFEHGDANYRICRKLVPKKYPVTERVQIDEELIVYRNSKRLSAEEAPQAIEEIVPKDASQFFFFDGEQIIRYTDPENWEQIKQAIESVLGIPTIRRAVSDLDEVQKGLDRDFERRAKKRKSVRELAEELEERGNEIKRTKERIRELETKRDNLATTLRQQEIEMRQYEEMERLIKERDDIKHRIDEIDRGLEELRTEKLESSQRMPLIILIDDLERIVDHAQKMAAAGNKELAEKHRLEGELRLLEFLKRRSKEDPEALCVCGRKLDDDAVSMIEGLIETVGKKLESLDHQEETIRSPNLQKSTELLRAADFAKRQILHIERSIVELRNKRRSLKERLDTLRRRISEDAARKVPAIAKTIESVSRRIKEIERELHYEQGRLETLQEEYDAMKRKVKMGEPSNSELELLERASTLATKAQRALFHAITRMAQDKRAEVERIATEVHRSVTNKPERWAGVQIGLDFRMDILDKNGNPVPKKEISEGEKQVLAFSFIAGLAKTAKADTPVVMDSPIIRLDPEHRRKILEYLHELSGQVILLMIPGSELRDEYYSYSLFSDHISGVVRIVYDQGTDSSKFEVAE